MQRKRIGILISGTGSNMQAIVQACESQQIPADVVFVGSDNPAAAGLEWAREHGLDTFVVDYGKIRRRDAELLLGDEIERRNPDLLCLAGFMRLLSPSFIDRISPNPDDPRIMNIHPSLLPAFPGTDGYGDTFRHGCKVAGCTVHFVDCGEDTGPIIGQRFFAIESGDDLDGVRQKGLALEHQLYPECVRLFVEGRLKVQSAAQRSGHGRRVVSVD